MNKYSILFIFLLGSPSQPLFAWQEDSESIIRIVKRSFDQKAVIRESARAKIEKSRSDFVLQVTQDLEMASESKRISLLSQNLNILLVPIQKIAANVNGSVHQASLPRDIESINASTDRPVKCRNSQKVREVIHQQLVREIKKYCEIGDLNLLDKSKKNAAKLIAQSEIYQAIQNLCECLNNIGENADVYELEIILKKSDNPKITLFLTQTIQTILGFTPEGYFNGMCGVGVTKEMIEQMAKDEKRIAIESKNKVLRFLEANRELTRNQAMKLVAKKEFAYLKTEVNHYQAIHFGAFNYPSGFTRYGRDMLVYLEKNYDVKDGGRTQGNYEAMRAAMTGEFDEGFVQNIFQERNKFVGAKLCAIQIITNAGSKKFKKELFELAKFVPAKKKSTQNADYLMEYRVMLRQSAAAALAACHGKDALDGLKEIKPLDIGKTGYFDNLPYIIKEIEGRFSEQN